MKSVIIIGAGLGGIATAARLARAGYSVSVFEKQTTPGGRVEVVEGKGYRFDAGPTLFLMPDVWRDTYTDLGERMEDHLELTRLDPTYRVHFHDGSTLDLSANLVSMREQLDRVEKGAFHAYLQYLSEGYRHYNLSLEKFVGRNFLSYLDYFSLANLPLLFQVKALQKHSTNIARYFKDPRLQATFTFQNMYLGLSPYDAPATYSLLQYTEFADGVWFPKGGMYRTIEDLEEIAVQQGVHFHYHSAVKSIDTEAGRVVGVTLESGQVIKSDIVIANADLPYVYANLLPPDGSAQSLARKKYTSSALMFFWGFKGPRSPELLHHNVFLADDQYKLSFEKIFNKLTLPENPSFYLNAPSRTAPGLAPSDGDGIMALVPVGHIDEQQPQDWDELEAKSREIIFKHLQEIGIPDPAGSLEFEAKWGPPYYESSLNLAKGAAFGLSHNFLQVGYLRPHNRHKRFKNLYFVGASTHPGTGLPIVLLSAKLVTARIMNEIPVEQTKSISISKSTIERA